MHQPSDPIAAWMTTTPFTLDENEPVERAEALFRAHAIRHLPITREGQAVGVVSERDLFVAGRFAHTRGLPVGVLMTTEPVVVPPTAPIAEVADRLWKEREGVALVMAQGRLQGVFTAVDALRALAS